MTGPARFAWIITALVVLIPQACAHAVAPRDAVKHMPRLTHTSTFKIFSEDRPGNRSYTDNYRHEWRIDWEAPAVQLGSARARFKLHYTFSLSDNLDRIAGTSNDSRFDKFIARLDIDNARALKAFFELEQADTLSSGNPRIWKSVTIKKTNLYFDEPGFPKLAAAHRVITTCNYLGQQQILGSESSNTQFRANYEHDSPLAWQQVSALTELTRSRNYLPNQTGASTNKTVFDAQRRLKLDPLGTLVLGCHFEEHASSNPGAYGYNLNTAAQYSLALKGGVRDWPLSYQFNYNVNQRGFSEQPGNERTMRKLRLDFTPPVPAGKTAGLSYEHSFDEYQAKSNRTSTENQRLVWSFKPNPRTNAGVEYGLRQSTNLLAQLRTEDNEWLKANLNYKIPGDRGQLTSSFQEQLLRDPVSGSRNLSSILNLGTNFKLGPAAILNLFYNQRYDDNYKSLFALPMGKDSVTSGVSYNIRGHGLSLNASYNQIYDRYHNGKKKSREALVLNFRYQTAAQWAYQLVLRSNVQSDQSNAASGYDYTTKDEIQATVTCSF